MRQKGNRDASESGADTAGALEGANDSGTSPARMEHHRLPNPLRQESLRPARHPPGSPDFRLAGGRKTGKKGGFKKNDYYRPVKSGDDPNLILRQVV